MAVSIVEVTTEDAEVRLDRWFKRHYPALSHGRLEKLLRTGQIRIDGRRVKAATRLAEGDRIRVPPGLDSLQPAPARNRTSADAPSDADLDALRAAVLYRDDEVIAINKPAGLAVQGGSKVRHHLDAMLDGLRFDADERPRLVHRLDRDTSGVLVLARTAPAARRLTAAFREHTLRKLYWALVVGVPKPRRGRIETKLAKRRVGERERVSEAAETGQPAVTNYTVIESAGKRAAWLGLEPHTGRTHQLRVHCAESLGCPIVGDGKYGGAEAYAGGFARRLHLHARSLRLPRTGAAALTFVAPLPSHMGDAWRFLGFDEDDPSGSEDVSPI